MCYSTRLGMYEEKCGLDNILMSWGHDGKYKPENALHLWDVKPNIGLGSLRGMLFGIKLYIHMLSRVLIKASIHIFGIFEYSYVSLNHLYATKANEKLSSFELSSYGW